MLSPERSMEIQRLLGSDIVMAFDECPRADRPRAEIAASMELSMRWAQAQPRRVRCAAASTPSGAALFGIQQGALDEELRGASRRGADRDRLRRLRDRRARGGRGAGGDVRHARLRAGPAARRRAALPDGRRQARRPRRRGRARGRHVRLRAADPLGPQRPGVHLRPARSTCATRASPRTAARSTRAAPARPARTTRAPICTTCRRPARSSARC